MSQIEYPNYREVDGPWLIDETALLELEKVIVKTLTTLKERRVYKELRQKVSLVGSDDSQLIGENVKEIIQNPHLINFNPKEIIIEVFDGDDIILEFSHEWDSDDDAFYLGYDLNIDDSEIKFQIKYYFDKWIEKNKPTRIERLWFFNSSWISLISGFVLFISFLGIFFPSNEDYKSKLKREAAGIIKEGVDSTNFNRAISIILQLQSEYVPENYVGKEIKPTDNIIKTAIISLFLLIAAIFKPVNIIGLGRNGPKIRKYRIWIKLITITIPTLLILTPFIRRISDWLY